MRKPAKPKKFTGTLSNKTAKTKASLIFQRRERKDRTVDAGIQYGLLGGVPGAAFGAVASTLVENQSFISGIGIMAGSMAITGSILGSLKGRSAYSSESRKVRAATNLVGKALSEEVLPNSELRNFLNKWKYVFVNRKGEIVGSKVNVPKLFKVGYVRLETRKILDGTYAREVA